MEERFLGQLLLTGIPGPELDAATARRLRALQPGGFILFSRNLRSAAQLRKLIDDLRDLSEFEPIVTIDQEGGRVSRLRYIGNEPPNAVQLTARGDAALIHRHGELTARLLRLFGFNLDLCPVLDIGWDDSADNSLRGRTWGSEPQQVITNAGVFNRALRGGGVLSCGKHFPGYASAEVDPHHELPVIHKPVEQMEAEELLPFSALLPELDSLMTCHSHYPCFDADQPRLPASLSRNIVTRLLRDRMGFEGLVMTDDLDMGAILNEVGFEQTILQALLAGNDLLMICHRLEMVEQARDHLRGAPEPALQIALERVEVLKRRLKPPTAFSEQRFREIDEDIWRLRVDTLGEQQARVLSDEDGKRSPVELY